MIYKRFALYYAPRPETALARFGRSWLGTDPESGLIEDTDPLPGWTRAAHSDLTAAPRRYALHGTLKPPFRVADGLSPDDLLEAADALAKQCAPISLPPPRIRALGQFLALCPSEPDPRLNALAAVCVQTLDRFRAPPSDAELAKRRAASLTPHQEDMLERWGYPYVFDEFRFHVTLTGPVEPARHPGLIDGLSYRLTDVLSEPFEIRDLCVFGEPSDGSPFRLVRRLAL